MYNFNILKMSKFANQCKFSGSFQVLLLRSPFVGLSDSDHLVVSVSTLMTPVNYML